MELEFIACIVLLLGLGFLATIEMAFGFISDVGLRILVSDAQEKGETKTAAFLGEILIEPFQFRMLLGSSIQTLVVLLSVLLTSITFAWLHTGGSSPQIQFLVTVILLNLVLTLLFGKAIPQMILTRGPEDTLLLFLPAFQPLYRIISFMALPWRYISALLEGSEPTTGLVAEGQPGEREEADGDDIQAFIDVGEEEGILEEREGELIHSILEFGHKLVNEVMTPRTEIVALLATATLKEARELMIESKYSRLPAYKEQIDNIEGIAYVRDLLQSWSEENERESIQSLLRPAYFIPETKEVAELLREMQKAHVQLAMVIDEYGGVAGLVTIEDLLEEIVGEIEDEDNAISQDSQIVENCEGDYEVPGSTELTKIERLFDLDIEDDDDYTTIAGLVISETGRVPERGTHLRVRGLDVEVLESDQRRIDRLRLRRVDDTANNGTPLEIVSR